jgi:hypothetical protein
MRYYNSFAFTGTPLVTGDQSPEPPEVYRFESEGAQATGIFWTLNNKKGDTVQHRPNRHQKALELVLTIALSSNW